SLLASVGPKADAWSGGHARATLSVRYREPKMLRALRAAFFVVLFAACATAPDTARTDRADIDVVTEDIARFWIAYDAIRAEPDRDQHLSLLNALYLDVGSPGLHAMNRARSYRSGEYLTAMRDYRRYLDAVRGNTLRVESFKQDIASGMREMRALYPGDRSVPVYFVIGAFRASGTANDGKMLIGAELAMADRTVPTDELAETLPHLVDFVAGQPIDNVVALTLHEYVHAQQRAISGNDLLSQTLFEGVAEYLSTAAIGRRSKADAIAYGEANRSAVLAAFAQDIGKTDFSGWIWNTPDNAFGMRDLGYYVGYVLADAYIMQADDRGTAIRELIELDYQDRAAVAAVVDATCVFPQPVAAYTAER
ncbi:MAG: hypothetical protein AAFO62_07055, partial [Pseudomonadota bacterium]